MGSPPIPSKEPPLPTRALTRTHGGADHRMHKLRANGHTVTMAGDRTQFTAALRRTDGQRYVITITPSDLPEDVKTSTLFLAYPQQVLMNAALHALCDWSDQQDSA